MALLRALRISQNGKTGTIFTAEGNRVKQLTDGKNPIAEEVTLEQLAAEEEAKATEAKATESEHDPDLDGPIEETKPAAKPIRKGGKKPADAGEAAEVK